MTLPLLMVPGMMCDARLFSPQIAAFSGARPVMVHTPNTADTVARLAEEILRHAPPQFALLGLSLGGIVAMEMIAQAPERVERLALLDTNAWAEKEHIKARRQPQMDAARAGDLVRIMRDEMKPGYLAEGPTQGQILDLCMAMAIAQGPDVFIRQSVALRDRPDQTEALKAYQGNALVLCGIDDRLCPLDRHEHMHASLPNSRLAVIEGAGHLPVLEQPERTNAEIKAWLEASTG